MAEMKDVAETKKKSEIEVVLDQELYEQAKAALAPYHIFLEVYLEMCIKLTVDKKEWVMDKFNKGISVEDILAVISWEAVMDLRSAKVDSDRLDEYDMYLNDLIERRNRADLMRKNCKVALEKVRRDGQLEILLTGYREGIFSTEAIVSVAEKAGCLDDMISRFEKDESPEVAQKFFQEWDPDFTKVTPAERKRMDAAEAEIETVSHEDIDWE